MWSSLGVALSMRPIKTAVSHVGLVVRRAGPGWPVGLSPLKFAGCPAGVGGGLHRGFRVSRAILVEAKVTSRSIEAEAHRVFTNLSRTFWKGAVERAVKTAIQVFVALLSAEISAS